MSRRRPPPRRQSLPPLWPMVMATVVRLKEVSADSVMRWRGSRVATTPSVNWDHAAVRTTAKPKVHFSQLKGFFRTKPTAAGSWSMNPPLPSSFCGETVRIRNVPVLALTVDTLAPEIPAGLNHSDVGSDARAV
jgi:hypothetical protein